jgi:hypothetical protein
MAAQPNLSAKAFGVQDENGELVAWKICLLQRELLL